MNILKCAPRHPTHNTMIKRVLAEFIGTYFLVFSGTSALVANDLTAGGMTDFGIALAFALAVAATIYALDKLSGAHINPAVTLALWSAKRFPGRRVLPYMASQILGAIAASLCVYLVFPGHPTLGATLPSGSLWQSFMLEILLTFILIYTLCLVTSASGSVKRFTALIVGTIVGLEAYFGGPISGASMNPARSIGPALVSGHLGHLPIYIAAPIIGGYLAMIACGFFHKQACCGSTS